MKIRQSGFIVVLVLFTFLLVLFNSTRRENDEPAPRQPEEGFTHSSRDPSTEEMLFLQEESSALVDRNVSRSVALDAFYVEWEDSIRKRKNGAPSHGIISLVVKASQAGLGGEVVAEIMDSYGPGSERKQLIARCVHFAKDASQMKEIYESMEFDEDLKGFSLGLSRFLAQNSRNDVDGFSAQVQSVDLEFLGSRKSAVILDAATQFINGLEYTNDPSDEKISEAVDSVFNGGFESAEQRDLVERIADSRPFIAWSRYTMMDEAPGVVGGRIVQNMVRQNAPKAFGIFAYEEQHAGFLKDGFGEWLKIDSRTPISWFETNQASLPATNVNWIRASISEYATTKGREDFGIAREWAKTITDPSIRQQTFEKIDQAESKVREEERAGTNPVSE